MTSSRSARSIWSRLRFLFSIRWLVLIASVIIFSLSAYFLLAPWQLARNEQRIAQNALVAEALTKPPGEISDLMALDSPPNTGNVWHAVEVTGTFDTEQESYVRLRQDNAGQPAYEVVVPLVLSDGSAVLIDRGYRSFASVEKAEPLPPVPSGEVTVTGRIQLDQTDPKNRPAVTGPDGRTQYTAVSSQIITDYPTYGGYLQLVADSPGALDAIALPTADPGPFFSYALQWIGFGTVAIVGIGFFIYREFSDPSDGPIYIDDVPESTTGDVVGPSTQAAGTATDSAARAGGQGRKTRFDKSLLYDD